MKNGNYGSKRVAAALAAAFVFAGLFGCTSEIPAETGGGEADLRSGEAKEQVGTVQTPMMAMEEAGGCGVVVGCLWHDPQWPGGCRQMGLCWGHQVRGIGICTTGCN